MNEADRILAQRKRAEALRQQRSAADVGAGRERRVREWGAVLEAGLPGLVRALVSAGYPGLTEVRWRRPPGFVSQLWSLGREETHAAFPVARVYGGRGFQGESFEMTLYVLPDGKLYRGEWNVPRTVAEYVASELKGSAGHPDSRGMGAWADHGWLLREAADVVARFRETGELPAP